MSDKLSYKDAGVNIEAATSALSRIKKNIKRTYTEGVLSDVGLFGGLFAVPEGIKDPVLVSSADGVGTKVKVASMAGRYESIGHDIVAHCTDDILVQGAYPLFFMDYFASSKLEGDVLDQIVKGITDECITNGAALLGGETAEMPGVYSEGEYDLVGFIVGMVAREKIIDGSKIKPGDVILGLPSNGLHTNGYSLARKIIFELMKLKIDEFVPELNCTTADALLAPHISYFPAIKPLLEKDLVNGLAHITGGGLIDNVPRILPGNCKAVIKKGSWPVLPIFQMMQREGNVAAEEMFHAFNMGIGMVVICSPDSKEETVAIWKDAGVQFYEIGEIGAGESKTELI